LNWALKILWYFLKRQAKTRLLWKTKRQALVIYLQTLQVTRKLVITALLCFFVLQGIVIAGVGALVTGVWLLEIEPEVKLQILFATFASMLIVPTVLICWFLSERFWFRISGAEKLVESLRTK
jgi:hypothetical protein